MVSVISWYMERAEHPSKSRLSLFIVLSVHRPGLNDAPLYLALCPTCPFLASTLFPPKHCPQLQEQLIGLLSAETDFYDVIAISKTSNISSRATP